MSEGEAKQFPQWAWDALDDISGHAMLESEQQEAIKLAMERLERLATLEATAEKLPESLEHAWARYTQLFGVPPRGTRKQLAALCELIPNKAALAADSEAKV